VATTVQQLIDRITERTLAPEPIAIIEDVTGALAQVGRALTGLARDGLTPGASLRQRTAVDLAAACTHIGGLWPHTGGPLTDLAGAAADLIGRDRALLGRDHRWAVTVELAEVADRTAVLGRRLLPQAAVAELTAVRRLALAVERDAQADPPTAVAAAMLDRIVPAPGPPSPAADAGAVDAVAALVAAVERAVRGEELRLRDFRAAVAAAEVTSRAAAPVVAAAAGGDAGPLLVTGLAWQLAGRTSTVFTDGRRGADPDPRGVTAWAQALAGAVRAETGSPDEGPVTRTADGPAAASERLRQVTAQLPVLAEQLTAAVDRWARVGGLYARARDLPPMEDMPADRVRAVIAGRHVPVQGADLGALRRATDRATDLSTGLADALHRSTADPPAHRHLAALHASRARAGTDRRHGHPPAARSGAPAGPAAPGDGGLSIPIQ
jgi:hypothetical protein